MVRKTKNIGAILAVAPSQHSSQYSRAASSGPGSQSSRQIAERSQVEAYVQRTAGSAGGVEVDGKPTPCFCTVHVVDLLRTAKLNLTIDQSSCMLFCSLQSEAV